MWASARARWRWRRSSTAMSGSRWSVMNAVNRWPSWSVNFSCAPGCALSPADQPRARRPPAEVAQLVRRARGIGTQRHGHPAGRLGRELCQCPLGARDLIGRVLGGAITRSEHPGQRFARLIEIRHQRREPEPALVVRSGAVVGRVRDHERRVQIDRDLRRRSAQPHATARAAASARRSRSSIAGSAAIRSIIRYALESEQTSPNNGRRSRRQPRSARQSPPSASVTARSRKTSPGSCPERRCLTAASPADNAPLNPVRSAI